MNEGEEQEMREFREVLVDLQASQLESNEKLHDLTLAIVGDDEKGIVGVVQRQQKQSQRIRVIEGIGSFVVVFLLISNETFKSIFVSIIK